MSAKKRHTLAKMGQLICEVCGFDFAERYGKLGKDFIECHHTVPVSELKPNSKTHLEDVARTKENR